MIINQQAQAEQAQAVTAQQVQAVEQAQAPYIAPAQTPPAYTAPSQPAYQVDWSQEGRDRDEYNASVTSNYDGTGQDNPWGK